MSARSTRGHAKAPCTALRASLRDRVRGGAVVCGACEGVCAQERPTFASRDVLEDQGGGEFDFIANMFRLSGPCMCICCCSEEAGDDSDSDDDYDY